MSIADYAVHRGCSDSYVRRLRRAQRLVLTAAGLVDVVATDALLAATSDPLRGGDRNRGAADAGGEPAAAPGVVGDISLREAMRRERLARARLAELELGEEAGELARTKDVERDVFTLARQAVERLRSMPGRLRIALAAESDAAKCEQLLEAEIAKVCTELQNAARAIATPAPPVGDAEPRGAA
jgi:hypothetical protein